MQTALASVEDLPVLPPMAAPSAGYRHYYSSLGAAGFRFCRLCPPFAARRVAKSSSQQHWHRVVTHGASRRVMGSR
jgi:hypothetical protein